MLSTRESLVQLIESYNKDKSESDRLKFVHGGSSARLAIIGTKVEFKNYKDNKMLKTTVPAAIFPDGLLRKKYGLHPLSGERDMGTFAYGSRRDGVNYDRVSGMELDENYLNYSIDVVSSYAHTSPSHNIHEDILECLKELEADRYVAVLKKLIMHITNLWISDRDTAIKYAKDYIIFLKNEYATALKNDSANEKMIKYFKKYISRIEDILTEKSIVFVSDASFKHEISHSYPIIYCSTMMGNKFYNGVDGEVTQNGELSLDSVKVMITDPEHVDILKEKNKSLGLKTEVYGYSILKKEIAKDEKLDRMDADFLLATDKETLTQMLMTKKISSEIYTKKINQCTQTYLCENKGEAYLELAFWLLKNADKDGINLSHLNYMQYKDSQLLTKIKAKLRVNNDYFHPEGKDLPFGGEALFRRQLKLHYGACYIELVDRWGDEQIFAKNFLDYKLPISKVIIDLDNLLKNQSGRCSPNACRLNILECFYQVMKVDVLNHPEHKETIDARLKEVYFRFEKIFQTDPELREHAQYYDLYEILILKKSPLWCEYEKPVTPAQQQPSSVPEKLQDSTLPKYGRLFSTSDKTPLRDSIKEHSIPCTIL